MLHLYGDVPVALLEQAGPFREPRLVPIRTARHEAHRERLSGPWLAGISGCAWPAGGQRGQHSAARSRPGEGHEPPRVSAFRSMACTPPFQVSSTDPYRTGCPGRAPFPVRLVAGGRSRGDGWTVRQRCLSRGGLCPCSGSTSAKGGSQSLVLNSSDAGEYGATQSILARMVPARRQSVSEHD